VPGIFYRIILFKKMFCIERQKHVEFRISRFVFGQWFSPGTSVFSTNKTDRYIVERGVEHHKPSSLAT
jgi:hypothetical protein